MAVKMLLLSINGNVQIWNGNNGELQHLEFENQKLIHCAMISEEMALADLMGMSLFSILFNFCMICVYFYCGHIDFLW